MATKPVVEFQHVVKDYATGWLKRGQLRALNDVTFAIEPGQVFGLLGPNRAGKTTLVKLLLSLCRPTSGMVTRLGKPVADRSTLCIGYVHENQAFPRYLTATSLLEYYGALSLLSEPVVKERVPQLLERVGLADRAREPISRFSKGMIQRLGVAQARINDPTLLVLDEPSEGLDLAGRQMIRDLAAEERERGHTVILVSHLLTEVELLCDRVAVLVAGRLAHFGPLPELLEDPDTGRTRTLEQALTEVYQPASPEAPAPKVLEGALPS